jgi:uncharacterized protein YecT (DUF1311 family)
MAKLVAVWTIMILTCQCARAHAAEHGQPVPPHELTSRGNITWQSTEEYKRAIGSCHETHGPQFLACLKEHVRSEAAQLDAVYKGTIDFLKSAPDELAKLRQSQREWLKFQKANCEFARAVAPKDIPFSEGSPDEFYFDCVLKSTIDRRVEFRSLVGD